MKKKIVTLAGGLGNQMLQYALYVYLISKYKNCTLYLKPDSLNEHHNFNIDALFPQITFSRNNKFLNWYLSLFEFIKRISTFLNRRFKTTKFDLILNVLPIEVHNFPTWHNYTFINQINQELNNVFIFPDLESKANQELERIILAKNSVSVHIRRGDYVNNIYWRSILGDICDIEYYRLSISKINESIKNPYFIIFSDDIAWVKDNLQLTNAIYVNWNTGNISFIDMQLMAMCKHNIIANSTFSLMAAWLNNNPNKIVISPSKWRNYHRDITGEKFVPDNWLVINTSKPNVSIVLNGRIKKSNLKNIVCQTYTDFEILIDEEYSNLFYDDRIKKKSEHVPKGTHVFKLNDSELHDFSNRKYLSTLLNCYLIKQIDNKAL